MMDYAKFYFRVCIARQVRGMSQTEFAKKVGISRTTLSAYENHSHHANQRPSLIIAMMMAKMLNVSLDWLAGLSDENGVKI
jgi:DNA-binding XRE family transcriptional regulator